MTPDSLRSSLPPDTLSCSNQAQRRRLIRQHVRVAILRNGRIVWWRRYWT